MNPDDTTWDAWRNEDGRWTVQLAWKAGMSDNVAHFRYAPGAHGGTVSAFDDAASQLIDPDFSRPLRPLAPVPQLALEEPEQPVDPPVEQHIEPEEEPQPAPKPARARKSKARPAVPAWEDVLLGVRSSGGER